MARATSPLIDETANPGIEVGPPSPEEAENAEALRLRADIAQTRENIESTIEALQHKLSPAALAEQATTAVRDATIGKVEDMVQKAEDRIQRTGHSVLDTLRENPLPAALAGFGIAWLFMRRRSAMRFGYRETGIRTSFRGPSRTGRYDEERRDTGVEAEGLAPRAEGAASEVGQKISEKAGETGQKISEKASEVGHAISDKARDAGQAIKRYAEEAQESGRRAEDRLEQMYRDSPLAFGAAALAAGTAIGLAIPISRKEDEWMGATRDELVGKAAGMAKEALGKVEGAAENVSKIAGAAAEATQKAEKAIEQQAP